LVDVGLSVTVDTEDRVAKKVGEVVGLEATSPHPTNETITNTIVID
jgi:hypothetical protein